MRMEINWRPGGAQGNYPKFADGERLLFAVRGAAFRNEPAYWIFYPVSVVCCSETPASFIDCQGDESGSWGWADVAWYLPVREIDLPISEKP